MKYNYVVWINGIATMAFFIAFVLSKFNFWLYFIIALLFSALMAMEINYLQIKELLEDLREE